MKKLRKLGLSIGLSLLMSTAHSGTLLGIFEGNQGWEMEKVEALETWQSKKNAVVTLFTGWSEFSAMLLFDYQLPKIWEHGSIPLITWEPQFTKNTPNDIETLIANGHYDQYISDWAVSLKQFLSGTDGKLGTKDDRRAYIRFAHEMNGNWYDWSASKGLNTPKDYIAMWQYVWKIFEQEGIDRDHLQWMWSVSATDYGDFTAEQYYPGDQYVDWLAMDGYNFSNTLPSSNWRTPEQIFSEMHQRLEQLAPNKPIAISEVATTSQTLNGIDLDSKSVWIKQLGDYIKANNVGLLSWFNLDKETYWKAFDGTFGSDESNGTFYYPAYKTMINDEAMIAADVKNVRIITDKQFRGEFSLATHESAKKCEVNYTKTKQWSGGYVANISLTSDFTLSDNWKMKWTFDNNEKISSSWRAEITQKDKQVSVLAPTWWKWMPSDKKPNFGLVVNGEGYSPKSITLDGVSCSVVSH